MANKAVLLPVDWKRQSVPELRSKSDRTEAIILKQLEVSACDLGIVLFGTRFGSPTGVADSGTVEELLELVKAQKRVMPYLGTGRAPRTLAEAEQHKKVLAFKEEWSSSALFGEYSSLEALEDQLKNGIVHAARELVQEHGDEGLSAPSRPKGTSASREMDQLRDEFTTLRADFNRMFELVTRSQPNQALPAPGTLEAPTVHQLEGCWKAAGVQSTYYCKLVDGELRMPYCYGGDEHLTGEFYGLHLIGDSVFGRFRWFKRSISGFVHLRRAGSGFVGGWWYAEDLPKFVREGEVSEIAKLTGRSPNWAGMTPLKLVRVAPQKIPAWAQAFFNDAERFRSGRS